LRSVSASPSDATSAGRSSKINERSSSIALRASSRTTCSCSFARLRLGVDEQRGGIRRQGHAEQGLIDGVVQVAGEAVAFFDDRQLAAPLGQVRVRDRDGGVRQQPMLTRQSTKSHPTAPTSRRDEARRSRVGRANSARAPSRCWITRFAGKNRVYAPHKPFMELSEIERPAVG
jgi:hypothetical protein